MQHTKTHQFLTIVSTFTFTFISHSTFTSFPIGCFASSQPDVANHSHKLHKRILQRQLYSWSTYISCFLAVRHIKWPHLELTIYIRLQNSPVPPRSQLLQQPQQLPYWEIQPPFSPSRIIAQNSSSHRTSTSLTVLLRLINNFLNPAPA